MSRSATKQPNPALMNPTPYQIRNLVLDYLCHHCYTNTARAFARDSSVRQLDADGDEIMRSDGKTAMILSFIQRYATQYSTGRVDDAIALLDNHFPKVLSISSLASEPAASSRAEYSLSNSVEPDHLILNLHILAFIEACRTVPLNYPPSQPQLSDSPASPADPDAYEEATALLNLAKKLYARTHMIQDPAIRDIYLKEVTNVGGLLAYKVPEDSPMAKYLTQERRDATECGLPSLSQLELSTRYTSAIWSLLHDFRFKPHADSPLPPTNGSRSTPSLKGSNPVDKEGLEAAPPFNLQLFLDAKS
ncbi:hypothetical protein C8J56DRAFT_1006229 [Mycena floridula]|nr:hypothetical protein C8J56DRAFT_1006229 [Mycena floridula]